MKLTTIRCVVLVAIGAAFCSLGCNSDDNRVLTDDQAKAGQAQERKNIEASSMPDSAKKELESHLGGAPYNPGGGAQAAKSHGVDIPAGGRTQ